MKTETSSNSQPPKKTKKSLRAAKVRKNGCRSIEERYRVLIEQMPLGIVIFRIATAPSDYICMEINPAAQRALLITEADAIGRSVKTIMHPHRVKETVVLLKQACSRGYAKMCAPYQTDKDHPAVIKCFHAVLLSSKEVSLTINDSHAEANQHYHTLLEYIPHQTFIVDQSGFISEFSHHATDPVASRKNANSRQPMDASLSPPFTDQDLRLDLRRRLLHHIENKTSADLKTGRHTENKLSLTVTPFSESAIISAIDIDSDFDGQEEKHQFVSQLQQSQKLEAIGTLAGGIAHEFNNILWIISGNTEMAMTKVSEKDPVTKHLQRVIKACTRAQALVMQILEFSRESDQTLKPLNLNTITKESVRLLRASLPKTIDIRLKVAPSAIMIMADIRQIHQVIVRLCTNGAQAMTENGGILDITTTILEPEAQRPRDLPPGEHVCLTITDSGHGIQPEVIDRIFDPFFTTNKNRQGTGMGLSAVHGIIKKHNGTITVTSRPGQTTLAVYLPLYLQPKHDIEVDSFDQLPGGDEKIMLVDDETSLLDVGKQILAKLGYTVEPVADAREALAIFEAASQDYDLIISDHIMPNMTGAQMAHKIRSIRADIPVFLYSGALPFESENELHRHNISAYLMKPLDIRELAQTIRKHLDKY